MLRLMVVGVVLCELAGGVRAEDNAKLVIGKWQVVKASPKTFPIGALLELSKDENVKVTAKREDKEVVHEGTYKVVGDAIIITVKVEGEEQKHTLTITKISDTEMVTEHGGGGTIEFTRKK
jgi:uncharacterized protein (TIGR03066 family)